MTIDIDALKQDKRPQSSILVHALINRLEAAEKELAELRSSMKFRTSLIGRTEAERDELRAENAGLVDDMNLLRDNNTALRARIEAMERQRPVRLVLRSDELDEQIRRATDQAWAEKIQVPGGMVALYALPGAKGEAK